MDDHGLAHRFLSAFDHWLVLALRAVCVACFSLLLLLLAGNVFVRFVPVAAFFWFDEIVEWLFAWMIFFGAAALWARDEHFRLECLRDKVAGTPLGHLLRALLEAVSLFFLAVFFYQAARLTILARDWTPVFNVSRRCLYVCMPLSGLIMVGYSLRNIARELAALRRCLPGPGGQDTV